MSLSCQHSQRGECLSCPSAQTPYAEQLRQKEQHLVDLLAPYEPFRREQSCVGETVGFRNKAKMAVIGSSGGIVLGLRHPDGRAVDLTDCPLYPEAMQATLRGIRRWIGEAGLRPYRVDKRRGEVKFVLLTRSRQGEYLLRFVLRSTEQLERIRRALPELLKEHPAINVVSVNLQPVHMARLEGDEEIYLTDARQIEERLNAIPLFIRPQSFFQTNPDVAEALYAQAKTWAEEPRRVWDLFCGVGGFGLHCAASGSHLTGIEISEEAVRCAGESARRLGLDNVEFKALDSRSFVSRETPDLLIVNPPRRGIGEALAGRLDASGIQTILYSSCRAETLAEDLGHMKHYRVEAVRLFDMFPHTAHYEVLVKLTRNG